MALFLNTLQVIRVYFLLRQLLLDLDGVSETRLPLSKPVDCVYMNDCLNLSKGFLCNFRRSKLLTLSVIANELYAGSMWSRYLWIYYKSTYRRIWCIAPYYIAPLEKN